MSHIDRLRRSPDASGQLTGITPTAFDRPLAPLTPRYEQPEARRKDRPGRKRRPGGGRRHASAPADRLLMLLIHDRTCVTHASLGLLLSLDDSAVGRDINPLQPRLAGTFRIPERRVELTGEAIRELSCDATERPTRRPRRGQRAYDSGEAKRHTLQAQAVVVRREEPPGPGAKERRRVRVAAVSPTSPGKLHDREVYGRRRVVGPPGARGMGDTGYVGTALETPTERPRGGGPGARQKARNRRVARRRIVAEHGVGKMEVWRIASERYRNPMRRQTLIMKDVAGLQNLMSA